MKAILSALLLIWVCLSVELARPDLIPGHCLIITAACAVMFWFANGTGILIGGSALLLDWIVRPASLPLPALLVPVAAVLLLNVRRRPSWQQRRLPRLPESWRLPVLTMLALLLQQVSELLPLAFSEPLQTLDALRGQIADAALIAIPLSVAVALLQHAANELGIRRTPH